MTGRKVKEVTITAEGRDKGKTFVITEMPATQGEKWAIRVILALAKSGIDIPPEVLKAGWAGLAVVGIHGVFRLDYKDAEPLLDEMLECVQIKEPAIVRPWFSSDVEEVATLLRLRMEVFELHTGFSIPVPPWTSGKGTGTKEEGD